MKDFKEEEVEKLKEKESKLFKFVDAITQKFNLKNVFEVYYGYFDGKYINKLKNLELAIKVLLIVVAIQTFGIFFLAVTAIDAYKERIINLSVVKSSLIAGERYVIGKDTASKSGFEMLAFAALDKMNNYTYRNYKFNSEWCLKFVHPKNYDELYAEISKDVSFAVENRVEQTFEMKDFTYKQLDKSTARITAAGYLTRKVGGIITIKNKSYKSSVTVHIANYQPFLTGLELVYTDTKRKERKERKEKLENLDVGIGEGEIKNEKTK
jgi:hypothetical protein